MWIAKNKITGEVFDDSKFSNIFDCQKWIDEHINQDKLKDDYAEFLACQKVKKDNNSAKYNFIYMVFRLDLCFKSNLVLCYNIQQKRFCDGFDF